MTNSRINEDIPSANNRGDDHTQETVTWLIADGLRTEERMKQIVKTGEGGLNGAGALVTDFDASSKASISPRRSKQDIS